VLSNGFTDPEALIPLAQTYGDAPIQVLDQSLDQIHAPSCDFFEVTVFQALVTASYSGITHLSRMITLPHVSAAPSDCWLL